VYQLLLKVASTRNPNIIPVENGSNSIGSHAIPPNCSNPEYLFIYGICTATLDPKQLRKLTNAQVQVTSHGQMDYIVKCVY
jgi:hypothetical protein